MYWHRPAEELIFLTESEHHSLHNKAKKGKKLSEDARNNISKGKKGKKFSNEHKKHLSEAHKGVKHSAYGMHWYHNDVENIRAKECPPGCEPGMLKK